MKFSLAKQVLLDGINKVAGVVSTRPSMPILSNVLLDASDGELKLTTTSMELTILTKVPCIVEKAGSITLPAKKLQSIIRELRDGEVSLEVSGTVATIRCNRAQFKLNGLPANEFPGLPVFKEAREFKVQQNVLNQRVRVHQWEIRVRSIREEILDQRRHWHLRLLLSLLFQVRADLRARKCPIQ